MAWVTAMAAGGEQTRSAHARDVSLGARIPMFKSKDFQANGVCGWGWVGVIDHVMTRLDCFGKEKYVTHRLGELFEVQAVELFPLGRAVNHKAILRLHPAFCGDLQFSISLSSGHLIKLIVGHTEIDKAYAFNSLAPDRCGTHFENIISKHIITD